MQLQRWRSLAFCSLPISRSELFHTQQEDRGSALPGWGRKSQFPFWEGRGSEALWCSELLPKVGRAGVGSAVLGRRTERQRREIFHGGAHREKVGIGWEEQAGSLTALGRTDQQRQTTSLPNWKGMHECFKITNFLAQGWQNFRTYYRANEKCFNEASEFYSLTDYDLSSCNLDYSFNFMLKTKQNRTACFLRMLLPAPLSLGFSRLMGSVIPYLNTSWTAFKGMSLFVSKLGCPLVSISENQWRSWRCWWCRLRAGAALPPCWFFLICPLVLGLSAARSGCPGSPLLIAGSCQPQSHSWVGGGEGQSWPAGLGNGQQEKPGSSGSSALASSLLLSESLKTQVKPEKIHMK